VRMQTGNARRTRTSQPKGSARYSGLPYAVARPIAETAWLAVVIPAWNMRNLVVRGNVAPPGVLAARASFMPRLSVTIS
jgi:hypothetical protein